MNTQPVAVPIFIAFILLPFHSDLTFVNFSKYFYVKFTS